MFCLIEQNMPSNPCNLSPLYYTCISLFLLSYLSFYSIYNMVSLHLFVLSLLCFFTLYLFFRFGIIHRLKLPFYIWQPFNLFKYSRPSYGIPTQFWNKSFWTNVSAESLFTLGADMFVKEFIFNNDTVILNDCT